MYARLRVMKTREQKGITSSCHGLEVRVRW